MRRARRAPCRARQSGRYPAAIGCVPWLTSKAVAKRLLALASYCVVVDKAPPNQKPMVRPELINPDKAFPNEAIWQLRDLMPMFPMIVTEPKQIMGHSRIHPFPTYR